MKRQGYPARMFVFFLRPPRLTRVRIFYPLNSLAVDILTLIGRQRPPCNFIKEGLVPIVSLRPRQRAYLALISLFPLHKYLPALMALQSSIESWTEELEAGIYFTRRIILRVNSSKHFRRLFSFVSTFHTRADKSMNNKCDNPPNILGMY